MSENRALDSTQRNFAAAAIRDSASEKEVEEQDDNDDGETR